VSFGYRFSLTLKEKPMSLVLHLQPGDKIVVGNETFYVEAAFICITGPNGQMVNLTEDDAQLMPDVLVRLAQLPSLPGLALAISAPKDVAILRIRKEQVQ
jgi:hypothetical protein